MSYDSTRENKLLVHLPGGKTRYFIQCERGIFYSDMAAGETVFVNNVDHNISNYSECDYTRDLLAQNLHHTIALPSHRHLVKIAEEKVQMINCPLNRDDVRGAEDIWGKIWDD